METNNIYVNINDDLVDKLFKTRIKQQNNPNSYTELFIYDNSIYKIYFNNPLLSIQNIETLEILFKNIKELSKVKEIILPTKFIIYNNHIVGFKMPYIKGILYSDFLKIINKDIAKSYFIKLLEIINKTKQFSFPFSFNDLHEDNIIIDGYGNINIIDCDSFVTYNKVYKNEFGTVYGRYLNNNVTTKSTEGTDYISLLCMILNYLLKNTYDKNPIIYLENCNAISNLIKRTKNDDFTLTKLDIDNLFNLDITKLKPNESILTRIKSKIKIANFKRLVKN